MSRQILAPVRRNRQLKGALLLTCQELAHRADGYSGQVTISFSYLASKIHMSKRTAIRHINRLLEMGIIARQRFWKPGGCWGVNRYRFLIKWERPTTHLSSGDILSHKFPKQENTSGEQEKYGTLADAEKAQKMVLEWLTKGSKLYEFAHSLANPVYQG